jgi:protein TonB
MEHTSPAPIVQDSIRWVVDVAPSFPGGEEALKAYLKENMVYPTLALEAGVEGVVRVEFVVMQDGLSKHVRVAKGERNAELHAEAMRLVRRIHSWVPARINGIPVAAHTSVMIPFRIKD